MESLVTIFAIILFLGSVIGSIFGNMIASEFYDCTPAIARWLIEKAVARLPERKRQQYREEWLAHAEEYPGKLGQLLHACGCMRATSKLMKETNDESLSGLRGVGGIELAHRQTALLSKVTLSGVGIHSGLPVTMTIHPADAGTGLRFIRTGLENDERGRELCVDVRAVTATEFATVLEMRRARWCLPPNMYLQRYAGSVWTMR